MAAAGGVSSSLPRGVALPKLSTWSCAACGLQNERALAHCRRCREPAPRAADAGASAGASWKEVLDPSSRQIYYWNVDTGETTWTRPAALGDAPYASGYYGRGASAPDVQAQLEQQNRAWLARPAKKQSDFDPSKFQRTEGANELNIWYGKYMGEHWKGGYGKDRAPTRCVPDTDAGATKGSRMFADTAFFCLHFARGACFKGEECLFLHHIPTARDDGRLDLAHDVFGRLRHATHRDDMGGTGSMESSSRTLYVGGLTSRAGVDLEAVVRKHFAAWGEIEHINVIPRKLIAFVRYRFRANSEFAREAMTNQALDGSEILNVRWAHEDPNPKAKAAAADADVDAMLAAMNARELQAARAADVACGGDHNVCVPEASMEWARVATVQEETSAQPLVVSTPDEGCEQGACTSAAAAAATAAAAAYQAAIVQQYYAAYMAAMGAGAASPLPSAQRAESQVKPRDASIECCAEAAVTRTPGSPRAHHPTDSPCVNRSPERDVATTHIPALPVHDELPEATQQFRAPSQPASEEYTAAPARTMTNAQEHDVAVSSETIPLAVVTQLGAKRSRPAHDASLGDAMAAMAAMAATAATAAPDGSTAEGAGRTPPSVRRRIASPESCDQGAVR